MLRNRQKGHQHFFTEAPVLINPNENKSMQLNLTNNEIRIIGCLMEKSVVTPDLYPLTLNALTSACNQKSARDPVMTLSPGIVQHAARLMAEKNLVMIEEGARRGVEKYKQRFCNTRFSELQFDSAQFAIICLLFLRARKRQVSYARTVGDYISSTTIPLSPRPCRV
jgi:uncharacterized protein YceH (UPF0502 family)